MTPVSIERVKVVEAQREHIMPLAARLRDSDLEALRVAGITAVAAMELCYTRSVMRRTAFLDGEVAAMWGCRGVMLGGTGDAWLFASEGIARVPRLALRMALGEMAAFRAVFRRMTGVVFASDPRACRFIERLGGTIQPGDGPFRLYEVA